MPQMQFVWFLFVCMFLLQAPHRNETRGGKKSHHHRLCTFKDALAPPAQSGLCFGPRGSGALISRSVFSTGAAPGAAAPPLSPSLGGLLCLLALPSPCLIHRGLWQCSVSQRGAGKWGLFPRCPLGPCRGGMVTSWGTRGSRAISELNKREQSSTCAQMYTC